MKILAIYHSHSNQTREAVEALISSFKEPGDEIDLVAIRPKKSFPFPWTGKAFFDVFVDTVLENKIELEPLVIPAKDYELVVLGIQPWFLSLSLPVAAFFKQTAAEVLNGKKVIVVMTCRKMWRMAYRQLITELQRFNVKLIHPFILEDQNKRNLKTYFLTVYWQLTGKKKLKNYQIGISEWALNHLASDGTKLSRHLRSGVEHQSKIDFNWCHSSKLWQQEALGKKIFIWWAKKIERHSMVGSGKRRLLLRIFILNLLSLIILSPFIMLFLWSKKHLNQSSTGLTYGEVKS